MVVEEMRSFLIIAVITARPGGGGLPGSTILHIQDVAILCKLNFPILSLSLILFYFFFETVIYSFRETLDELNNGGA